MEERLDDAIHVLRSHAERLPGEMYPGPGAPLHPTSAAGGAAAAVPPGYSSNTGSIQPGVPVDQLVSRHGNSTVHATELHRSVRIAYRAVDWGNTDAPRENLQ